MAGHLKRFRWEVEWGRGRPKTGDSMIAQWSTQLIRIPWTVVMKTKPSHDCTAH